MTRTIPVVENPRRKAKKRKTYSRKQLAAGFGGKRRKSPKRRKKTTTRRVTRRRNPTLAALANPRRKAYRRRRNPSMGGFTKMLNLKLATGVAIGLIVPNLLVDQVKTRFFAALPNTGMTGMAVRIGAAVVIGYTTKKFLKQPEIATGIIAGAVGFELFKLAQTHLLPMIGLSGVNTYYQTSDANGLSGYEAMTPAAGLNTYYPTREQMAI